MILTDNAKIVLKSRYFSDNDHSWEDVVDRMVGEIKKVDPDDGFISVLRDSVLNGDFIPGGRILRNLGKLKGSMMNCNCLPIGDSIESIGECIKDSLIIAAHGGGVGINFSTLRPSGVIMATRGGKSSGLVSFLKGMDSISGIIETGGQRRSANIAVCDVSHPEIFDFINVKLKDGLLSNFNLSVAINNDFLEAVEKDDVWNLSFNNKVYDTVKASELWDLIINNMIKSGEPGLLNMSNLVKNNTYYFSPIIATNPCGEQPLPAWGSCCLGSINLVNMLNGFNKIDYDKFESTINIGVRFLDNIIDLNYYPINELANEAINSRRIGLGVMGLADYFIKRKIRYGSKESLRDINCIFKYLRDNAYLCSAQLAKSKSSFPKFDNFLYSRASFIKKLPAKIRSMIKDIGIRNSNLITCAPTGTTSLIANVSSGIEPVPYKAYVRHDRICDRVYVHPEYSDAIKNNVDDIGDFFVDTTDISPEDHFNVQVEIQKYVDSGISKTINLPNNYSAAQLKKLLLENMYDLKGVTVYRDGSKSNQVLNCMTYNDVIKYVYGKNCDNTLSEGDVNCGSSMCNV